MENEFIQYAPYLVIVISFLTSYKIFVTPKDLDNELDKRLDKYVLKETYNVAINEIKADVMEIKVKIDRIYDKVVGLG